MKSEELLVKFIIYQKCLIHFLDFQEKFMCIALDCKKSYEVLFVVKA